MSYTNKTDTHKNIGKWEKIVASGGAVREYRPPPARKIKKKQKPMLPNTRNYPAKDKHHSELHLIWRKHERDLWAIVGWGGLSFFFSLFSSLCCSTVILRHFLSPWGLFFIRATEWRVTVMTSKLIKRHKITLAPPLRLEKTREQKENIQPSGSFFFSLSLWLVFIIRFPRFSSF